ncbi:hypothetical protein [Pseudoduganella namucuonensis]|uniref:Uncharacterized protein n=1 Tax=Pseudoduganella namucuonensis TaxID=1035707 RepID=A0A1I7JWI9_9BURK|nr:hypothetical protein [Pseudoduganella namucuonensis]SFU89563.1 hypothetical protein SAMN05216552_1013109 [Pseudoduganella namucuonensis]
MSVTRIAFVRGTPRLAGWRLALLVVGAIALLPAGAHWLRQWSAIASLEAQLETARPRRSMEPALPAAQQREHDQQTRAVAEAVRQLNLPVPRLLKTLQAPADMRVALLGLDLNGQPPQDAAATTGPAGSLKIAAEAETARDMLNYLAFLNQQRMFSSVYLVKHEVAAGDAAHPYRFQLEAQWRL